MNTVPGHFLRRLQGFDKQLTLRWADRRRAWSVERYCRLSSDWLGEHPTERQWFAWSRGKFIAAEVTQDAAGHYHVTREWRDVPQHILWWDQPLDGGLLGRLQECDGWARDRAGEVIRRGDQRAESQRRDDRRELGAVEQEIGQQLRRDTGQSVTVRVQGTKTTNE